MYWSQNKSLGCCIHYLLLQALDVEIFKFQIAFTEVVFYSVLIVHVTIVLLLVLKSMIQVSGFSCLFLNDLHSNIVPDHVLLSL